MKHYSIYKTANTALATIASVVLAMGTMPVSRAQDPEPLYTVPRVGVSQFPVREGSASSEYLQLEKAVGIGHMLPFTYKLIGVDKTPFDLSTLRGKIIVFDFYVWNCEPYMRAMPHLSKLAKAYQPRNVAFLTVCEDDDDHEGLVHMAKTYGGRGLSFSIDPKADQASKAHLNPDMYQGEWPQSLRAVLSGVYGWPVQIVVNPEGKVVAIFQGYGDAKHPEMKLLRRSIDLTLRQAAKPAAAKPPTASQ